MSHPDSSSDHTEFLSGEYISNCCGSPVYDEYEVCSCCGEPCDLELVDDSEMTLGAMDRF